MASNDKLILPSRSPCPILGTNLPYITLTNKQHYIRIRNIRIKDLFNLHFCLSPILKVKPHKNVSLYVCEWKSNYPSQLCSH